MALCILSSQDLECRKGYPGLSHLGLPGWEVEILQLGESLHFNETMSTLIINTLPPSLQLGLC